jgi:N-acylneuraminate cytidylyltransferase
VRILCVVPARGGSKGVPRKNLRVVGGKPLLVWTVEQALSAHPALDVVVSTDDEEIAAVARQCGAETPFLRPDELAQDRSLDLPVFQHALDWLAQHEGYRPEIVVQLRPTSPVRPRGLVDEAVRLLLAHPDADTVRGVVPAGQNPHKMWRIDADTGHMRSLLAVDGIAEPYNAPRQALPPVYWQTGHIDAIRPRVFQTGSMSGRVILPVMIDPAYTVDIDTPKDWGRSEWLVLHGGLELVDPGQRRPLPDNVELVILDFDGVLTDNRVWVREDGVEMVAANRSDSWGVGLLRKAGIKVVILSTEVNPVVAARARKMGVPVHQGISDKASALPGLLAEFGTPAARTIYVGNDTNDTPCFPLVACALAPADAQPDARRSADIVLSLPGGHGAVRELCDLLLERREACGNQNS